MPGCRAAHGDSHVHPPTPTDDHTSAADANHHTAHGHADPTGHSYCRAHATHLHSDEPARASYGDVDTRTHAYWYTDTHAYQHSCATTADSDRRTYGQDHSNA
jgi:hypothetical protein